MSGGWGRVEAPTTWENADTIRQFDQGNNGWGGGWGGGWGAALNEEETTAMLSSVGITPDAAATEDQLRQLWTNQGFSEEAVSGMLANAERIWPDGPPTGEQLLNFYGGFAGPDGQLSSGDLARANGSLLSRSGYQGPTGPGGSWGGGGWWGGWGPPGW